MADTNKWNPIYSNLQIVIRKLLSHILTYDREEATISSQLDCIGERLLGHIDALAGWATETPHY